MATHSSPYYYSSFQSAEISYFSGEGVDQWLYQIEDFFSRYRTVPEQRFVVAVRYLSGEAMEWYRQMWLGRRLSTWDNFVVDLRHRFKPPEIQQSRAELLGSMWNVCEELKQTLTKMKTQNSVYMSTLSKLKSHVSSISTSDFSIDNVDESDAVQTELITTELRAPVESGLVSENTANEVIVSEGVFEDSDALYLDGSIDLVLDSSRVGSVSKYFIVKSTSNLCLSDVCANASMNVPFIADGRYVKPPAKPPEDGSSKNVDYIQFDSSAILDIKSPNWAFVGVLVHYDGLAERLKLIEKLEIDTIFLKKWHDGAAGLFELQTDIKLDDLRKFGCIDNINTMSELMEAGHFSESCNGLYRDVRLDCPATGKQFVVKEILVLVMHNLVDDAFKFYKQEDSLGDSGSSYYGMRLDSLQSCDLDWNTRVSSLCGDFHLDKQAAISNTIIKVYKDVKQLTIRWVWDLWDQITLKENNQEGSNENGTIIDMFRLLNIHLPVYLASIITEVSTVMVPYSKWHGKEMFKTQNLLTGVWKNKSKFQGFIISDWEGLNMSTSQTHKNYTHLVLVGKQAVSGMVLSPPLHLKTNESEDEKKTQEVLRTRFKGIYKVIKNVLDLTGVSKVELAKALAERLFDDGNFVVWIDMYGHTEKHYVAHFIGKPPGYIDHKKGSEFIEYVRRRQYNVFLFDEIEKGHHLVFNTLLTGVEKQFAPEKISSMIVIKMREDLDNRTMKYMASNPKAFWRLRTSRDRDMAIKTRSSTSQTTAEMISSNKGVDLYSTMTRATLEELHMNLFSKYVYPVEKCLSDAYIDKSYVHDLLFLDITPLSIGLGIADGVVTVAIPSNTDLLTLKAQLFFTYSNNQLGVLIQIFGGESTRILNNKLLCKFDLSGIPPAPSNVPQLIVCFDTYATDDFEVSANENITQLDNLCNLTVVKIYQGGDGTVTGGWINDGPSPSVGINQTLLHIRCSYFGNHLLVDFILSVGYVNHILKFSLPRPPEINDLEDKVKFKGGGMLRTGIIGNIRGGLVFGVTSLL